MDPITWLLIATVILTAQYIAAKISEKQPATTRTTTPQEQPPPIEEPEQLVEPIQILEEPAPETPDQSKEKEAEEEKPNPPENQDEIRRKALEDRRKPNPKT